MRQTEHWTEYPPDDPPEGNHWCAQCCHWDDECECPDPEDAGAPEDKMSVS